MAQTQLRARRFDGFGDADKSQPEQVTTEEDSEGDEDRHPKQARKNAKQPKSTSKPSGKQITFKEHSDSMILKVERWMNGEGVLDGVPASEAQSE